MSSVEIAELSGKNHNNVLKSIRAMEPAWEKTTGQNFPLVDYEKVTGNGTKRKFPMYQLNKRECLYVASKYNDEIRARIIIRLDELENNPNHQPHQLTETAAPYKEGEIIPVKMGSRTNQIYVKGGVIFAKFGAIARYMGIHSTPTYYLEKWGWENSIKVPMSGGKQEAWFINAIAFGELIKTRNFSFEIVKTIYKDVFGIHKEGDNENQYSYMFTDSEMLDVIFALNQKPVNKGEVTRLLQNGKKR